jgi:uncharacterized DUF497 family protein
MKTIRFEWDNAKEKSNVAKHGVTFSEAKTVFYDPNARVIDDPEHSIKEDRFIILGISQKLRMLVICHCYRECDEVIRIISARKATTRESQAYEKGR